MSYYDREMNADSSFKNDVDAANEDSVAHEIEVTWRCTLHPFARFDPIDWYAERDGRMAALIELKSRTHSSQQYSTVFLNCRKWLALTLGSIGLGVPAFFFVRFTDALLWVPVIQIDGTQHRIGGCSRQVKSTSDIEPVIEVNIAEMRSLRAGKKEPHKTGAVV